MASFWNNYFVDGEFGGVFQNISNRQGFGLQRKNARYWFSVIF